ncbi:MAG: TIGR03757 family integrating conjugative element protein [Burkholderiales bacterium]|jgi:integrating conjugative element protein (TIGR03757 family)|nr:TIGR03757 family integrating conjugative element protein [Burkholderiales bacterium]
MMRGLLLIMGLVLSSAAPAEVLVFTDSAHPVRNTGEAKVFVLDRVVQIEREMSIGLPANIDEAEKIARAQLESPEGVKRIEELSHAYQGLMMAWQLGVSKIPAVVVDGQYVVYGQPDVMLAVRRIADKRNQPGGYELPTHTRPSVTFKPLPERLP